MQIKVPVITLYCFTLNNKHSIDKLEAFTSINGAKHYNIPINKEKIKLIKSSKPISFKKSLKFNLDQIIIFEPDFPVYWEVKT